jgi:hypothetical protein
MWAAQTLRKLECEGRFEYYVYDYVTKLCKQQAEVIRNHENEHIRGIGQGEAWQKIWEV